MFINARVRVGVVGSELLCSRGCTAVQVALGFADHEKVLRNKSMGLLFVLIDALLSSLTANSTKCKRGLVLGTGTEGR